MEYLTGVRSGSLSSLSVVIGLSSVGPQDQVLVDDDAEQPAGADGDGRLEIEVALGEPLSGLVGAVLGRFPKRAHEVVLFPAEGQLGANAQEGGKHDAFQEAPGVEVHLVLEAGIAGRVGGRQVLDHDGGAVSAG